MIIATHVSAEQNCLSSFLLFVAVDLCMKNIEIELQIDSGASIDFANVFKFPLQRTTPLLHLCGHRQTTTPSENLKLNQNRNVCKIASFMLCDARSEMEIYARTL
jgi:hypothetical protein